MNSTTDSGRKTKIGKAVKQYVDVAIAELVKSRETQPPETETETETKRGKGK